MGSPLKSSPLNFALAGLLLMSLLYGEGCLAQDSPGLPTPAASTFGGRDIIMHVPPQLPAQGSRALVVVLHGGGGSASRIADRRNQTALNMNAAADRHGFLVAYLNGSRAMRLIGANALAWNAGGGCCGLPAKTGVDDVAYISGAVDFLAAQYGVSRDRIFGMGHSNGAMMVQRLLCERGLFAAGVSVSGTLNLQVAACPAARGLSLLAIHGALDENVPINGGAGKGPGGGPYNSQEYARRMFSSSGASYTLDIVPGAAHNIDEIDVALQKLEGASLAQKIARFFGLVR